MRTRELFVHCPECGEEHFIGDMETLDIEESPEGWDMLSFVCPDTGKTTKALIRGK